ncbi:hypothetical protein D3C80_1843710 [compost metagenome]
MQPATITDIHISCLAEVTLGVNVMTRVIPILIRVINQKTCIPVIFISTILDSFVCQYFINCPGACVLPIRSILTSILTSTGTDGYISFQSSFISFQT